ncbi:hypothetical protein WT24_11915 [Burkholderia sp. MSMB1078WGS]|uniref:DUF2827 domain-containing protein n=1 Tax=Burkholderia sp. MSMB1078WGS TaxID=1637900 RepID=UPI00075A4ED7|nr:DUF2827 domain-containing protein [Burkholderia sp. MSMB1078WGS]KVT12758.1 hypothetical protein WT24_11915 [Burkholderia sp. MSMB1078WGS]
MRIGISLVTRAGQSIWDNGLGQNVFFLIKLLKALPAVRDVVLLNCGPEPQLPDDIRALLPDLKLLSPQQATDAIDIAIEMSGGLDIEWLDHLRARGKRTVYFCCGQPYVGLIEPSVFKRGGYFSRANRCDEIWILPKDRVFRPMLETLHRCPVFEVPYLWDPMFIDQRARLLGGVGRHFGFQPTQRLPEVTRALRVAIFEPNISVVKCCMLPMLIADTAYRCAPDAVAELTVLNSAHFEQHPTFSFMRNALELTGAGLVRVDHRHDFVDFMSHAADAVVAHQWQNDQNNLHLDALYGGYPLVHNSAWLSGLGYYYPDFDVQAGAQALVRAARQHDAKVADYKRDVCAFLGRLHPLAEENGARYFKQLLHVSARGRHGGQSC